METYNFLGPIPAWNPTFQDTLQFWPHTPNSDRLPLYGEKAGLERSHPRFSTL